MKFKPISAMRAQALLSQRAKLLTDVSQSLSGGPPINWNAGDRAAYTAQLRGLGFHLVTKGQARALGLDIPPGTPPVGRGEFGPPLSQFLDLYILEVHAAEPVEEPADGQVEPLGEGRHCRQDIGRRQVTERGRGHAVECTLPLG